MIRNYLKIAWRNIKRHKAYSGLNIVGLAIGIAGCLLILQYVAFELSFENFQEKKDRLYRVQQDRYDNGKLSTRWVSGAYAVGNSFKEAIPEIDQYAKVVSTRPAVTDINNKLVKTEQVYFASTAFFNVLTYPLIAGDKDKALAEPFQAALSEATAIKLFGTTDVVGKPLQLNRDNNFTVTAVFKDPPVNTQLRPSMLLSYETFRKMNGPDNDPDVAWAWDGCLTYITLKPGADPRLVEKKFIPVVEKGVGELMKQYNSSVTYSLQPIGDIHLYSNFMGEPGATGDGKTTYLLLGIAFVIIIIAWVNYINLATARAITRAQEVGVRKAIGSQRRQLVVQFMTESALLNGIALVLALGLMAIAIPSFNAISGRELSFTLFASSSFIISLSVLFVIGVIFSGLYPAFVLSGFKPIAVLKGKMGATRQSGLLRKSLVVFQFAASLLLLIGTVVVYNQISFMRRQSLGIDIEQTLVVSPPLVGIDSTFLQKIGAFRQDLLKNSSIKSVTVSTSIPGERVDWNAGGIKLTGSPDNTQKQYRVIGVDYDFLSTYGLKLIAGRAFSKDFGSDKTSVIFNRKGIEQLGFTDPAQALGKKIDFWGEVYTIEGVTEDFHQQSLREAYEPLILRLIPDVRGFTSLKVQSANLPAVISEAQTAFGQFFPGNTFEYFMLDDHFDQQYKADQRFGSVFLVFTSLAILVACLGLFGLASFTTLQRTREIGIRTVLGASVGSILNLLYREFTLLFLIAFVIAAPLAWFAAGSWLDNYAFRVGVHWSWFVWPFLLLIVVAILTVSVQSVKAALANPVRSLRSS
ncbi:MAG: FtsX-like permease family protein [Chitinophagaceae bacterium]|nr:MAG: FtsX-like permease family protein [Chitinophagaceae bacterium]